jgi:hypothetical protein
MTARMVVVFQLELGLQDFCDIFEYLLRIVYLILLCARSNSFDIFPVKRVVNLDRHEAGMKYGKHAEGAFIWGMSPIAPTRSAQKAP